MSERSDSSVCASVAPFQENNLFLYACSRSGVPASEIGHIFRVLSQSIAVFSCHLVNKNELYPGMQRAAVKRHVHPLLSPSRATIKNHTHTTVRSDENTQNATA